MNDLKLPPLLLLLFSLRRALKFDWLRLRNASQRIILERLPLVDLGIAPELSAPAIPSLTIVRAIADLSLRVKLPCRLFKVVSGATTSSSAPSPWRRWRVDGTTLALFLMKTADLLPRSLVRVGTPSIVDSSATGSTAFLERT
jgi:hypothetical protein